MLHHLGAGKHFEEWSQRSQSNHGPMLRRSNLAGLDREASALLFTKMNLALATHLLSASGSKQIAADRYCSKILPSEHHFSLFIGGLDHPQTFEA